ncbi:MAG: type II toxin-antitoxin system HicA family toxin [Chitinophagales bacterium]|nr:type II toxin-antitoxin system HicA family toxin [Hyphomicrobiales bacterium]
MSKSSREVIKLLLEDGWFDAGQTGSHRHFKHPVKKGKVTVPHPKRDFPVKTLKSIEKASGLIFT